MKQKTKPTIFSDLWKKLSCRLIVLTAVFLALLTVQPAVSFTAEQWSSRYNGPGNMWDHAAAIAVDGAGNVYVTGESDGSVTMEDYATIKYDSNGNELWTARYNGPEDADDWPKSIAVDNSGNVYVTGGSTGSNGYWAYATIKYDSNGNEQWAARYNGPGEGDEWGQAIAVDDSGNVYVSGNSEGSSTMEDYATIKYDPNGNPLWTSRYNGPGNEWDNVSDIAVDNLGNVYVTGESKSEINHSDYATIKYDTNGNELWSNRYNGPGNKWDNATALEIDGLGNVYVTGASYGSETNEDYATVKYDSGGDELWAARYNGAENSYDEATSIAVDALGYVYVTGVTGTGANADYATIKYTQGGTEQWTVIYNGPGNNRDRASSIAVDDSGNVYVTGESEGAGTKIDYATINYDSSGAEHWVERFNGPGNDLDEATAIAVDPSGNVFVSGISSGIETHKDFATIKYSNGIIEEIHPDVAGCISLGGSPLNNRRVRLKQRYERSQTVYTGQDGCYEFAKAVSGKNITVQIFGPVLSRHVPNITGCIYFQGSPLTETKTLLKQSRVYTRSLLTDNAGCYEFENAVPRKTFKVIIKGPAVP